MIEQRNQHKGFNFERNLPHQDNAVNAVIHVLGNATVTHKDQSLLGVLNPIIDIPFDIYKNNLIGIQISNQIDHSSRNFRKNESKILDISMETGTGKTYTYTKTIFEINRQLGIFKFIVVVPTVSIRAGTINFLKSEASRDHFKQEYSKEIKAFVLEGQKSKKNKKSIMPQAVTEFVRSQENGQYIYVLVVNGGMLNSTTMEEKFDQNIFDHYNNPFDALASVRPITIIDEPHRFKQENKTWEKIKKLNSQYIIRYGATFDNRYENLIYELTAVDAFNQDLVKGITTYVEEFKEGNNVNIKLLNTDGKEAKFELNNNGRKTAHTLAKNESLSKIHSEMANLSIENLNKTHVVLSNGLQLNKGSIINPYSYSDSLQDRMMNKAIENHFKLEKEFLTREVKIKPLTLFFIDDIEGYREGDNISGSLKEKVESLILAHAQKLLKSEKHDFYKAYLEKTAQDASLTHGGYFSKDNTESDEKVAKEVEEILHDKESLLSLDNPRRFIFSKWTLREGWDNPNVFQICKLRSSGSETSKLQEVGRGLRLPVNEYMNRVKNETFYLNYYVDFTEKDFAQDLVCEINEKSGAFTKEIINKVDEVVINRILKAYPELYKTDDEIYELLDNKGAIKRNNEFKEGGFKIFKDLFGKIFDEGIKNGKVRNEDSKKAKVSVRTEKYNELKALWEKINQQVILEYEFPNEEYFKSILRSYFSNNINSFKPQGVKTKIGGIKIEGNKAVFEEKELLDQEIMPLSMMKYSKFLLELSQQLMVNKKTLHAVFVEIQDEININDYLSQQTIRIIRAEFARYLLDNAMSKFKIGYKKVSNHIHPTAFTNSTGEPLNEIDSANIGKFEDSSSPPENYYFDKIFYDSDLELQNINKNIEEVIVYTKIPKNTIRIPVAGGASYSPDFAYVVKRKDGKQQLNLVVETKGKEKIDLRTEEEQKIKHAEKFFQELNKNNSIEVKFETQFKAENIADIIKKHL
ncbi:MAG: type III restriction-modification system endonuclease [Apibacter sp.]|nr:type III restriction-modification system endonuclease [Apibacter sp.]